MVLSGFNNTKKRTSPVQADSSCRLNAHQHGTLAEWRDVGCTATLPRGAVYCTSQGNLDEFDGYAQDGDEGSADRMVEQGKCTITQRALQANDFQESDIFACFLAPSGKAFYILKGFLN